VFQSPFFFLPCFGLSFFFFFFFFFPFFCFLTHPLFFLLFFFFSKSFPPCFANPKSKCFFPFSLSAVFFFQNFSFSFPLCVWWCYIRRVGSLVVLYLLRGEEVNAWCFKKKQKRFNPFFDKFFLGVLFKKHLSSGFFFCFLFFLFFFFLASPRLSRSPPPGRRRKRENSWVMEICGGVAFPKRGGGTGLRRRSRDRFPADRSQTAWGGAWHRTCRFLR